MSKSITASEKNQSPDDAASPPQPLVSEQKTIKRKRTKKTFAQRAIACPVDKTVRAPFASSAR
ncbi:hypothetical protein ACIP1U_29705 [Cupriavidus sp. NPDC089707]|uniref:hypothetical protein n=1 Tax=Cupriavidus sp. NPDC089707 TaxID=3363963 RepID=UPI00382C2AB6